MIEEKYTKITNPDVEDKFSNYPNTIRKKLLRLRQLILDTAQTIDVIDEIEETLKWGQPSFVTHPKTGSTVRIDQVKQKEDMYAMYFICTTNLLDNFRKKYPSKFKFEGNRAILFNLSDKLPKIELVEFVTMALTYHKNK